MKTINKKNWVRILNRNVRQVLKDKDTSFYTKGELYALLEKVWNDLDKTEAK